jgi:RNA polymerase sigma factor (sigma-70 family)
MHPIPALAPACFSTPNKPFFKKGRLQTPQPLPQPAYEEPEEVPSTLKKYIPDLLAGRLLPWQVCLRTGLPLATLLNSAHIPVSLERPAPPCVPTWAGGQSKKKPKTPPIWTYHEIETTHLGAQTGDLLPFEAALLFEISGKKIQSLLEKLSTPLSECPDWIPAWAQTNTPKKRVTPPALKQAYFETTTPWLEREITHLQHYWELDILTASDIAYFLEKTTEEVSRKAQELQLPPKRKKRTPWSGCQWTYEEGSPTDPKLLEPNTQRFVAEASATRFSLLYEEIQNLPPHSKRYKQIQREMEKIIELQTRIFSKYISVKSRKYNYQGTSSWLIQAELEQAGKTAIFECLRRWHPNRKIRYSRGAICIAITREMIAWVEKQRLIELPDRIRAVARKLKQAQDNGTLTEEYQRLQLEAGANCVKEAAKHQNTYAFVSTVPLMDTYSEEEAERGGVQSHKAECIENFTPYSTPEQNTDLGGLLCEAIETLPPEEKKAVQLYHGLLLSGEHSESKTLEEIGEMEGVTKERIRQRLTKARERMKRWLERKEIRTLNDAFSFR